ncbi:MAG TPA: ABC transporter ATP-binding protein [Candidatus Thermoplasmatota archaeon]|nr:ABC transporter ATP-binding protein [Candidatus Thermoplasmatota archaeon]
MEAGEPPALLLDAVEKSFGEVKALDGLTLRVGRGELYGLLGPNGAGKTTAIRVALGLARQDAGRAEVFGVPSPPRSVIQRVGFVPQEPALYRDLTVRENLELFAAVFGLDRARWADRFLRVLKFVELDSKADEVVRNLSGGQVRRTSIAAAMVHDPDLLVLDEPTVGVDPELRVSFWDHFASLKDQGKSILITTHYVAEASRCDRVGFVRAGKLVAEGPPADLLARTSTSSLEDAFLAFLRRDRGESP